MKKTTSGIGYSLMIIGFIGVLGFTFFVLTTNDLNALRFASVLNFVCLLMYMFGSIIEMKDLWFALTIYTQDKKPSRINEVKNIKAPNPNYIPKKKSMIFEILFLTIIIIVILLIAILVWSL